MLRVVTISEISAIDAIAASWSRLCQECGDETSVFSTPEWYRAWWQSFSGNAQLCLMTVWEDDVLLGVAPLMILRTRFRGIPVRQLQFVENGNSLQNDFILAPVRRSEVLAVIIDKLFSIRKRWDCVELKNIPEQRENYRLLLELLERHELCLLIKDGLHSPFIDIDQDWESYYRNRRARTRKTLRNVKNKLERAAQWRLERVTTEQAYRAIRPEIIAVSQHSWSYQQGDSFATEQNLLFFDRLTQLAASRGWLNIWGLYFDCQLVAFEYHLRYGNVIHGLRSCYHENFSSLSPGAFLDLQILKELFSAPEGLAGYNLGGSFDVHKRKWADSGNLHRNLQVFKRTPFSRFLYLIESQGVAVLRKLRDRLLLRARKGEL